MRITCPHDWQQVTIAAAMLLYAVSIALQVHHAWYLWFIPLLYPCLLWGMTRQFSTTLHDEET